MIFSVHSRHYSHMEMAFVVAILVLACGCLNWRRRRHNIPRDVRHLDYSTDLRIQELATWRSGGTAAQRHVGASMCHCPSSVLTQPAYIKFAIVCTCPLVLLGAYQSGKQILGACDQRPESCCIVSAIAAARQQAFDSQRLSTSFIGDDPIVIIRP